MTSILHRTTFETSRHLEFFDEKELQMQIGHERSRWPIALIKELIDNSLDACEGAGIAPVVSIDIEPNGVTVRDNGPGLPVETLVRSLDYSVRVSDKRHYVAPTRGQLGNALKTVWAAPLAIDGQRGQVEVWTHGTRYTIEVRLDRIAQTPILELSKVPSDVKNGTVIKMHLPRVASYLHSESNGGFYNPNLSDLAAGYTLCNPHLTLSVVDAGFDWTPSDPHWRKWTSADPTSPHWYTVEDLRNLVAANITAGINKSVREFVSEFRGLSGTAKQKRVVDGAGLSGQTLNDLVVNGDLDTIRLNELLAQMQAESRPVKAETVGIIGEAHFRRWMLASGAAADSVKYRKCSGEVDNLPYVLEIAFGVAENDSAHLRGAVGLNWTPTLRVPFGRMSELLGKCRIDADDPMLVAVHLAMPKFIFTDRAKSNVSLPERLHNNFEDAFVAVTKEWTKQKNQTARQLRLNTRQLERMRKQQRRSKITIKEACYEVMAQAYAKASSGGRFPANARQIMYAARPLVLAQCGEFYRNSASFTQGILPEYQTDYPEQTANWDVVYDDRGHLVEPHTRYQIGLGTLAVRRYVEGWTNGALPEVTAPDLVIGIDTFGPCNRYDAVLFVEKEGFNELLKASKIAERYDIAIQSTKGQTVTAARQLAEHYAQQGVRIFVLHDFDKSGIEIMANYQNDTQRYQYETRPLITDIGLRLGDVLALGLEIDGAEDVDYKSDVHPGVNLIECGATIEETQFLVRRGRAKNWTGKRVELNALTSEQLIHFIERKLQEHGVRKVVPDSDDFLEAAYRQAVIRVRAQKKIDTLFASLASEPIKIPHALRLQLMEQLEGSAQSWDAVLFDLATTEDGKKQA